MFNIGFGELAIICIVLIIAVGPERLPSMMKTVGKTMRTLRQASRDLRASTGIDELLREDFDIYTPPPPRRQAPPLGETVGREEALPAHTASLPSDAPITTQPDLGTVPVAPVHAPVEPSLPSDAPVAEPEATALSSAEPEATALSSAEPRITVPQAAATPAAQAPQPADHAPIAEAAVQGDPNRAPRPRES